MMKIGACSTHLEVQRKSKKEKYVDIGNATVWTVNWFYQAIG